MRSLIGRLAGLAIAIVVFTQFNSAEAVPAYARQTGLDCTTCHMSWLELTNIGRRFKLGGYQLMKAMAPDVERPLVTLSFEDPPPLIPLAFAIQAGETVTQNINTGGGASANFPRNAEVALSQASIFLNGKLIDGVGCFCQYTYVDVDRHASIDNTEIRAASEYQTDNFDALYGLSFNNNPTMSDVWNTTPVWGWPYIGSTVAIGPNANTVINGNLGQSVVGLSAYTLLQKTAYLEFGGYRTSDGVFSFMHSGNPIQDRTILSGTAPYYRLALTHDWDNAHQSAEIGTFGLTSNIYPNSLDPSGPTDHYKDTGFDAQYQYITDRHRFSFMFESIHENQSLTATYGGGGASNPTNGLNQINTKASYYFQKWYGINFGYQRTTGSSDQLLYNTGASVTGSANGSPNTSATILELDYLFALDGRQDHRTQRFVIQYTNYLKFNGASNNYDGFGRNAKDNNTLFVALWLLY
jgi:hypothetical protein